MADPIGINEAMVADNEHDSKEDNDGNFVRKNPNADNQDVNMPELAAYSVEISNSISDDATCA